MSLAFFIFSLIVWVEYFASAKMFSGLGGITGTLISILSKRGGGEFFPIFFDFVGEAGADLSGASEVSAGAWVNRK